MGRATLAGVAAAAPLLWMGCNAILGTESPVLEGSGGTSSSSSSTSSTSTSTSSTSASSTGSTSSSSGACSDPASWAHWSPDQARTFDTSKPAISVDSVTHLVWEAKAKSMPDQVTYDGPSGADAYCKGLVLANLTNWRVPTRIELASLVDFTLTSAPVLDGTAFPSTPIAVFWTSTPFEPMSGNNWVVSFSDGKVSPAVFANLNAVRCVHDPVASDAGTSPCQRYDLSTPTVAMDKETGIFWQLHADTATYTGDQAASVCSGLGGKWRMPTIEELLTLVDDARANPALDPTVFAGEPSGRYWSSTPSAQSSYPGQWFVDFKDGQSNRLIPTSNMAYVRCVHP